MRKKYKLLMNQSINVFGVTLYRIQALRSFGTIKKGEVGGYVEKEENLSQVFDNARVFGEARVFDNARVFGENYVVTTAETRRLASQLPLTSFTPPAQREESKE